MWRGGSEPAPVNLPELPADLRNKAAVAEVPTEPPPPCPGGGAGLALQQKIHPRRPPALLLSHPAARVVQLRAERAVSECADGQTHSVTLVLVMSSLRSRVDTGTRRL
eukprot:1180925-Prorocentrum_minimum.AAC.6